MVEGEILREYIVYWYGTMTAPVVVGETPPQVPLGTEFNIGCVWVNRGTTRATGHIDAVVTKPDGVEVPLEAVLNQDVAAAPDLGAQVGFTFILDQLGDYQMEFILLMVEGVLADKEITSVRYE